MYKFINVIITLLYLGAGLLGLWNIFSGIVDIVYGHWLVGIVELIIQIGILTWWISYCFFSDKKDKKQTGQRR